MRILDYVHETYSYNRRISLLSNHLAEVIPPGSRTLDVGCGDGQVAHLIMQKRPDVTIKGIDVLMRPHTKIPVAEFDGQVIPYSQGDFDVVMLNDVLHHTNDPMVLLREAVRVAGTAIVLKDHTRDGILAGMTLKFMDRVGNARHGVALPCNYWTEQQWLKAFETLGLCITTWKRDLRLYPRWADVVLGRSLHFIARLNRPV